MVCVTCNLTVTLSLSGVSCVCGRDPCVADFVFDDLMRVHGLLYVYSV